MQIFATPLRALLPQRRVGRLALAALLIGTGTVVLWASASNPATAGSAASAKKRCKIVVKIVHHHKTRVRVCHKVKPPPLPLAAKVIGKVSLGTSRLDEIASLAVGGGSIWAALADGHRIVRIDPATLHVTATITNPLATEWPPLLSFGADSVWLSEAIAPVGSDSPTGALVRIDPATNAVAATIPVGRSPEGLAFTSGAVWAANHRSDEPQSAPAPHTFTVSKVDVASNQETKRVVVETRADTGDPSQNFCCGLQGATAGAGSVWVADTTTSEVSRIDPVTGTVITTVSNPGFGACGGMAADDTSVWLTASCDEEGLWRIDPATNTVAATIKLPGVGGDVRVALGSIWVSTFVTGQAPTAKSTLTRINPATNKIVGRTPIPEAGPMTIGDGVIWMASGSTLLELRPS
jgi:YVTN family beta-propeller protein